jgi:hypothetical protein
VLFFPTLGWIIWGFVRSVRSLEIWRNESPHYDMCKYSTCFGTLRLGMT